MTGDPANAGARLGSVTRLEPANFRSFFTAYLTPARARFAVVTPRAGSARPLPTGLEASLSVPSAAASASGGAPPVAPLPSPAEAHRFRLANGLEVVLWPRPAFPSVTAALVFRGGSSTENPVGAEFYLGEGLPLRHCGGPPSARGISMQSESLSDAVLELAHGGAGNLSAILLALAQGAAAYRFDEWPVLKALEEKECPDLITADGIARLWNDVREEGTRRLDQRRLALGRSAGRQAVRSIGRALFKGTGYDPPAAVDLTKITTEDLAAWHASSRRPENAVLIVAGQLDLAGAETLVRGWFSSWRPGPAARPPRTPAAVVPVPAPAAPSATRLHQVTEPGAIQGQAFLGCRLGSGTGADSATARVFAQLLARNLRLRLRERLGATYGVQASLTELKLGTTMLMLEADVAREHLVTSLAQAVGRLDALTAGPPAQGLVRKAQLDVLRELAGPASSGRLVDLAAHLVALGRPLEELDRAPAETAQVTAHAVQAAAAACRRTLTLATVADAAALAGLPAALPGVVIEEVH